MDNYSFMPATVKINTFFHKKYDMVDLFTMTVIYL